MVALKTTFKSVSPLQVNDDNIIQALEENWQLVKEDEPSPQPRNPLESVVRTSIYNPLDVPVVLLALACLSLPLSSYLLYTRDSPWYQIVIHGLLLAALTRRFTLGLHITYHNPIFKGIFSFLNSTLFPVLLSIFFGQTPFTYYWHHLKMHHVTDNSPSDLSCTLFYQRDRLDHFLHYFLRFYLCGWFELPLFFARKGQWKPAIVVFCSEWICYLSMYFLAQSNFMATFMSFILPFNIVRFGMIQGNWVQHSFLERENPLGGGLENSITIVQSHYNKQCFNDGYHASHHLHPKRHFLDHPSSLLKDREIYKQHNAVVFKDMDYEMVWWYLMTRNYDALANNWVHVGLGPKPSHEEIKKIIQKKVERFSVDEIKKKK